MVRRAFFALLLVAAGLAGAANANSATYYVSASGSDAASGTSTTSAWRNVARVNSASLGAGDTVLFEGGQSFSGVLTPPSSGSSGAPVTFGSYGAGQANLRSGISLASRSWLVLRALRVDTGDWRTAGSTRGVMTSSSGSGVQNLVIEDCAFVNVAIGLLIQSRLDSGWTVRRNLIQLTRDSGILIYDPTKADEVGGSDMLFESNQLLDNGVDTSITYKKHAVYDIGTNLTWRKNVVRRFSEGGFSLRSRGNTLEGNTISDGPYAIYHSAYDGTAGTTRVVYNKISNVTGAAIELNSAGKTANVESFVIANNTIATTGDAPGIRLVGTAGSMTVANNVVTAGSGYTLRIDRLPGGGYTEKNNLWHSSTGAPTWAWLGTGYSSLASYKAASGHGAGDIAANPELDSLLVPLAGSPVVDAGSTSVPPLSYSGSCASGVFQYCGSSVDMGSEERTTGSVAPPPEPTVDTVKPELTITSPKHGQTVPLTFTITATASDASGIRNVTFWFDGNAPCVDTTAPYSSCSITTKQGGHSIRVRATDNAGNFSETSIKIWADRNASALKRTTASAKKKAPAKVTPLRRARRP